ncbi:MAG: metal-dependent transcriptional regulator [Chloroflexota bacterium]|nr:metal-dependent transcriptional regulator [Chloroflexota bacterium]
MDRRPSKTVEDYLQVMHYMTRDGVPIIGARLAERIGVAPPTVTATLQRMVRDGLIRMDAHKVVHLTDDGRELAESTVRRHALAERLLTDILGLGWSESHEEAHMVEHVISPKVERRLMQVLGNPTRCPHGNPIPGTGSRPSPRALPLSEARAGQRVVVERIVEEAEDDLDLMSYLERSGIVPRAQLEVVEVSPAAGLVTVTRDGVRISLGTPAARQVRVVDAADAEQDPELAPRSSRSEPAAYAERIRDLGVEEAARTRSG